MKIAIQIGTSTAIDAFFNICETEKFDMIYLIEPQVQYNDSIKLQYNKYRYKIFNVAITSQDVKTCKLYKMGECGGHYSLIKRKSYPNRKMKDKILYQIVSCITFNEFCEINKIQSVDLLCIDTEGLDDEILMSIDFNKAYIKKIIWEYWDHDNDDECGIYNTGHKIQMQVRNKLLKKGYAISFLDNVNLCAIKE